jgi:hypothetical protein
MTCLKLTANIFHSFSNNIETPFGASLDKFPNLLIREY